MKQQEKKLQRLMSICWKCASICAHEYLWQLRHNEAEVMIAEEFPKCQSLIGAIH